MALSEERRQSLLAYCHLTELADDPEVNLLIPVFYEAAVGYMAEAGVSEPEESTSRRAQYDLCVSALVLNDWDHRDTVEESHLEENPAFRRRLNQLKLTELPVSELDTTS